MPIDTSIYGQIQQPQQINPLAALAQAYQVKGLQSQMDRADREEAQQNRLLQLVGDPSFSTLSTADKASKLQGIGAFGQAGELVKSDAAASKDNRESERLKLDMAIKQREQMSGTLMQLAKDPSRAQEAMSFMVQQGIITPEYGQKVLQGAAQAANPSEFFMQGANAAISAKDQLAQQLQQQGQQITMRGQDMSQQTALRGQNMTDARAREFNASKEEENRLKREQKQETADMTKASQVASFDTMLGTLDRLSQHPGLKRSVGVIGKLPTMPGSDSANFQAELDSFQSQAFVPMVAQLKGMGALSDAEGKKLTQAVGALNPNMGEKAFRESIARITNDMNAARARVAGNKGGATGEFDAPAKSSSGTLQVTDAASYAKVPSGATYMTPDGKMRRKP